MSTINKKLEFFGPSKSFVPIHALKIPCFEPVDNFTQEKGFTGVFKTIMLILDQELKVEDNTDIEMIHSLSNIKFSKNIFTFL